MSSWAGWSRLDRVQLYFIRSVHEEEIVMKALVSRKSDSPTEEDGNVQMKTSLVFLLIELLPAGNEQLLVFVF